MAKTDVAKRRYAKSDGGQRVLIVRRRGLDGYIARWTSSCSGCYETGQHAPYDQKAQCYLGMGCEECGYTGKRRREEWVPLPEFSEQYFNRFFNRPKKVTP